MLSSRSLTIHPSQRFETSSARSKQQQYCFLHSACAVGYITMTGFLFSRPGFTGGAGEAWHWSSARQTVELAARPLWRFLSCRILKGYIVRRLEVGTMEWRVTYYVAFRYSCLYMHGLLEPGAYFCIIIKGPPLTEVENGISPKKQWVWIAIGEN